MTISRADSRLITDEERNKVLATYDVASKPLAVGTESEVYEYQDGTLLKLYADSSRLAYFETLRDMYDALDNPILPRIHQIDIHGNIITTVEKRLNGQPLEDFLPNLRDENLERAEALYLDAVFALKDMRLKERPKTYLLFDDDGVSDTSTQSFETFYADSLQKKIEEVGTFFPAPLIERASALVEALRSGPNAPLSLIHGDFFPGNVLVDSDLEKVNGIIDFGSFTLFGNYLLDVAGAFSFYKMYDPERSTIRKRLSSKILNRLSADEHRVFYQFVLGNAILTSNLYATTPDPREDDHFQWATDIVSNDEYWDMALG